MSPFAAGCALCGADLTHQRRHRRYPLVAAPRLRLPGWPLDTSQTLFGLVTLVLVIGAPVIGIVLALVVAVDGHRSGEHGFRNVMLALALLGVLQLFPSLALAPVLFRY